MCFYTPKDPLQYSKSWHFRCRTHTNQTRLLIYITPWATIVQVDTTRLYEIFYFVIYETFRKYFQLHLEEGCSNLLQMILNERKNLLYKERRVIVYSYIRKGVQIRWHRHSVIR